jgi:hypothetical protein
MFHNSCKLIGRVPVLVQKNGKMAQSLIRIAQQSKSTRVASVAQEKAESIANPELKIVLN